MNTVSPNLINQLDDALAAIQAAEASIQRMRTEVQTLRAPVEPPLPVPTPKGPGYCLHGKWTTKLTGRDLMVAIFKDLANHDPSFPQRFAEDAANSGRTRKHIARTREALYPGRPDLSKHSDEFAPGWFIGTNESNRTKRALTSAACRVMGYTPNREIWFRFP